MSFNSQRLLAICCVLLITSCSAVSSDNYKQIKAGMEKSEVEAILGSADECESALGFESCRWGDDEKYISVQFAGETVLGKSAKGL